MVFENIYNMEIITNMKSKKIKQNQIRVVNAFRQGLDARYGGTVGGHPTAGEHHLAAAAHHFQYHPALHHLHNNPVTLAEVLRKQTSLSKRLSQASSSIEYADHGNDELNVPELDVERLSSHSHTETAV